MLTFTNLYLITCNLLIFCEQAELITYFVDFKCRYLGHANLIRMVSHTLCFIFWPVMQTLFRSEILL